MTLYRDPPAPFDCVICSRPQMQGHWDRFRGPHMPIPPVCNTCEREWGRRADGQQINVKPDQRMIRQIWALASVISATAYCQQNGHRGPYDRA